jgi:hypothetical protein
MTIATTTELPTAGKIQTFAVMDRTGDTRTAFKVDDAVDARAAMARFAELTGKGYRAASMPAGGGPGTMLSEYDATAETVLFFPQIIGG